MTPAGALRAAALALAATGLLVGPPRARAAPSPSSAEALAALEAVLAERAATLAALPAPGPSDRALLRALDRALDRVRRPRAPGDASLAAAAAAGLRALRARVPPGSDDGLDAARDDLVRALVRRATSAAARGADEAAVLRERGPARRAGAKARAAAVLAARAADEKARPDAAARLGAQSLAVAARGSATAARARARLGLGAFDDVRAVFARSCNAAGCHGTPDRAGGLDLESDFVWGDLRRGTAVQPAAAARGRRLVVPGDPGASFLHAKAAGLQEPDEGDTMPGPGAPLADADLEIVRAWILAGAPPSSAADAVLRTPERGFQVRVPAFPVPAAGESRVEIVTSVPGTAELRGARIEFLLPPGVRIARLFEARDLPPTDDRNVADGSTREGLLLVDLGVWSLRAAAPGGTLDWVPPEGSGVPFVGGARLLLEAHADDLGALAAARGGAAVVNVHTVSVEEAPGRVGTMLGRDPGFLVAPGQTASHTVGATLSFLFHPGAVDVVGAYGLTRSRGEALEIRAWDGTDAFLNGFPPQSAFDRMGEENRIWLGEDWERPVFRAFAPGERTLPAGWGMLHRTRIRNPLDRHLGMGPSAIEDEIAEAVLFFVPGTFGDRTLWFPQPTQ